MDLAMYFLGCLIAALILWATYLAIQLRHQRYTNRLLAIYAAKCYEKLSTWEQLEVDSEFLTKPLPKP